MLLLCRFKNFQFDRATASNKDLAERYLHANFWENWSTRKDTVSDIIPKHRVASKRNKSVGLVGLMLSMDTGEEEEEGDKGGMVEGEDVMVGQSYGEVDRYLRLPQVSHVTNDGKDFDVLSWWKLHSFDFPCLSKMARQYLSLPCSSAGEVIHFICAVLYIPGVLCRPFS